ncbi:unnamed protein product [Thelazia callipaeda]|uniref:NodB homology domain-containing protein n=1 Tax=Thelazia callipaeda TaxID=103827 RepID=A0A0N5CNY0_THECL|nr:unnamed protein product [Thelazia callipaeda]
MFRSGLEIPNGLLPSEVPQMILLTFEGPIIDQTFLLYKSLFGGIYRNPNGCPITSTFFISNKWNNYDHTQWLMDFGHEIAVNSVSYENLDNATVTRWEEEIVGMRSALQHFSHAKASDILGVRAPKLRFGGDNQLDVMEKFGFVYDNSMITSGGPFWPQTLAYRTAWECLSKFCPNKAHPKLWEIPINPLKFLNSQNEFNMLTEAITRKHSSSEIATILEFNLNRSYNYNRAPFLLTIDNDFFTLLPEKRAISALKLFIHNALKKSDIYMITIKQALQWIKQPTRLMDIHNFEAWQCNQLVTGDLRPCQVSFLSS